MEAPESNIYAHSVALLQFARTLINTTTSALFISCYSTFIIMEFWGRSVVPEGDEDSCLLP